MFGTAWSSADVSATFVDMTTSAVVIVTDSVKMPCATVGMSSSTAEFPATRWFSGGCLKGSSCFVADNLQSKRVRNKCHTETVTKISGALGVILQHVFAHSSVHAANALAPDRPRTTHCGREGQSLQTQTGSGEKVAVPVSTISGQ